MSKKDLIGIVTSNKLNKTVKIICLKKLAHPKYIKTVTRITKLLVHDEQNKCKVGDFVIITKTRPISKKKSWSLKQIIN